MDWDWFFSSLAQSAAAIVAIFSGFIINKILSNQSSYALLTDQISQAISNALRLSDEVGGLYFSWYNERFNEMQIEDLESIVSDKNKEPETGWTAELLSDHISLSKYLSDSENRAQIQGAFDKYLEKKKKEHEAWLQRVRALSSSGGFVEHTPLHVPFFNKDLWQSLQKESERIDAVHREVKHHVRSIKNIIKSYTSFNQGFQEIRLWLLLDLLLFVSGVIYPLSFLPTASSSVSAPLLSFSIEHFWFLLCSLRGMLLLVVSIIFIATTVIFARINERTGKRPKDLDKLIEFADINTYSHHFAIVDERVERMRKQGMERRKQQAASGESGESSQERNAI